MKTCKVGVATFSHPHIYNSDAAREGFVRAEYQKMCDFLRESGCEVVDPITLTRDESSIRFGIATNAEADAAAQFLMARQADCLVINLNQWTNPHMAVSLIKQVGIPCAIYTSGGIDYPGETTAAAVFASMSESPAAPRNCLLLERFREWNRGDLLPWVRGVSAVSMLKRSRILSWGGTYGANIPYTRADDAFFEDSMVREIIYESEEYISMGARTIVAQQPGRIAAFANWMRQKGVAIDFDEKMLTQSVLNFQIAQYLAARDRLAVYAGENIAAAAIKCHFDVSTDCLGCTECLIPAFLPYFEDSEGEREVIPVACEGDIKGAITSALLTTIVPGVPTLFGDVIVHTDEHITVSNCGSSSVYWASRMREGQTLAKVTLCPQLHGRSGGAVRYLSAPGKVTAARLFRAKGRYFMYLGCGRVHEQTTYTPSTHGTHWPQTLVAFGTNHYDIFRTIPSNHIVLTEGDVTAEIEHYCRYQGIRVVRCDREESLKSYRDLIAYEL